MKLNKKSVFLFDGIGAAVSFMMTGFVLPRFTEVLGLTTQTLFFLAAFPFVYMIYSLSCYFFVKEIKGWMLLTIIMANFLYCLVSGGLIYFYSGISLWGQLLLLLEIGVVVGVLFIEYKVYKNQFSV